MRGVGLAAVGGMHVQHAHADGDVELRVNRLQLVADLVQMLLRQGKNRRSGAAQADAEQAGMLQRQGLRETGHDCCAIGLMETILDGLMQQGKVG